MPADIAAHGPGSSFLLSSPLVSGYIGPPHHLKELNADWKDSDDEKFRQPFATVLNGAMTRRVNHGPALLPISISRR